MQAAASTAPAILAAARRHAPARKRGCRQRSRAACVVIRAAPGPLFDVTAAPGAGRVDWHAVKSDLLDLFSRSQSVWPADYGTYAPFFVRLAWHNSGSYRVADGRGGAEGGRQRFDPERSWQDNTNLDKARNLLAPLKLKHGPALSWGDLFILSGTVAIEAMGGPVLGFCGGRIDDQDGSDSLALGPSPEQRAFHPCPVNGNCTPPLGAVAVGETKSLIYVDPEGHMGVPDPVRSAADVRWTFAGMAMNDTETVALIGGGHAFGKTHGACPAGAGALPRDDPANPWPGLCGSGRAADAFTSGIEGPWTTRPTRWDNEYFHNAFASSPAALDSAFAAAWYKLVTRDMGPHARCVGPWVPPPQPFQFPLPKPPPEPVDYAEVWAALHKGADPLLPAADAAALAYGCAASYRYTDNQGGCDGARIRFSPEVDFPANAGALEAIGKLRGVKKAFGARLSWADLITLAGHAAVAPHSGPMPFCGGRTDATDGAGSRWLQPLSAPSSAAYFKEHPTGLTAREVLAVWAAASRAVAATRRPPADFFRWVALATPTEVAEMPADLRVVHDDAELREAALDFASDPAAHKALLAKAWPRLMSLGRFDGPASSPCDDPAATLMLPPTDAPAPRASSH
ncbi:putative peroxidase/catalase [Emiliania huxleyi CCMP1516]|uniref:Plant heme peroxidase family profile domain-containing protein n=2 Tax=Emiliania huxleyi TaxID=2903 RepID=A0A0D3J1I0_EMIH1|nr:putative peroxidase/catalase [Emiliania huxleyi CCMP1516]EOD17365.1 putative peroxidase/catalase [Emiliania huxleyi CCMP1516]|eukprot:XP_005769794.1 putative peroxidase/catalase [Emiliania huxleyi CCMP1516]